jgi:hypothetical protein
MILIMRKTSDNLELYVFNYSELWEFSETNV